MRIGTRRSALALAQAELVALAIGGSERVEIVPIVTAGDAGTDGGAGAGGGAGPGTGTGAPAGASAETAARAGDKSRWVAELEQALLDGRVDIAVHSAKDVPGELADGTALLAAPARAPAEDVLCGTAALEQLASGARVGTSSLRRIAQLRAAREDIEVVPLRGNVDTRLSKLADPDERLDAIVLARAGLVRLGRDGDAGGTLDARRFVPAPGQGSLALQGRSGDERALSAALSIGDARTLACLRAERALAAELGADCDTALGAHAVLAADERLLLRAWVGLPDGSAWLTDELHGEQAAPDALGASVAERLRAVGAEELLASAREMAGGR